MTFTMMSRQKLAFDILNEYPSFLMPPIRLEIGQNVGMFGSTKTVNLVSEVQMSGLVDAISTLVPIETTVGKTKTVDLVSGDILLDVNGPDKARLMGLTKKLKQLEDGKQSIFDIQLVGTPKSNETIKNEKSSQIRQLGTCGRDVINPYGLTKLLLDEITRDIHIEDQEWKVMLLRYFNFVGAHESGKLGKLMFKYKKEVAKKWLIKWKWKNDVKDLTDLQELQLQEPQKRLHFSAIIKKMVVDIIEFLLSIHQTNVLVGTEARGMLRQQMSVPIELYNKEKPKVSRKLPNLRKSRILVMDDVFIRSTFWEMVIWCIGSWKKERNRKWDKKTREGLRDRDRVKMRLNMLELYSQELYFITGLREQGSHFVQVVNEANYHVVFKIKTSNFQRQPSMVDPTDMISKERLLIQLEGTEEVVTGKADIIMWFNNGVNECKFSVFFLFKFW
ncbi:putative isomerase [Helianthus annuus]|nr:putative isomerase [Helianthus annuus]KAJ0908914.1 putative isomerase [Helianthus annuus]